MTSVKPMSMQAKCRERERVHTHVSLHECLEIEASNIAVHLLDAVERDGDKRLQIGKHLAVVGAHVHELGDAMNEVVVRDADSGGSRRVVDMRIGGRRGTGCPVSFGGGLLRMEKRKVVAGQRVSEGRAMMEKTHNE